MNDVADITLQQIIAKPREIAPAIKAEGVTRLAIFGSRARGVFKPRLRGGAKSSRPHQTFVKRHIQKAGK